MSRMTIEMRKQAHCIRETNKTSDLMRGLTFNEFINACIPNTPS